MLKDLAILPKPSVRPFWKYIMDSEPSEENAI
jgi:hypothetical protein